MIQVGFEDITLDLEMGKFALAGDVDEAGGLQFFQVVGESGGCNGLAFAYIGAANAFRLGADLAQDFMPARIRQGFGDTLNLNFGECCEFRQLYSVARNVAYALLRAVFALLRTRNKVPSRRSNECERGTHQ